MARNGSSREGSSLAITRQPDPRTLSNAFVQSPLPATEPVWMHIPRGYRDPASTNSVLHLKKSLYGHVVAPKLWYEYISKYFVKHGLRRSKHDKCLWYGHNLMLVQYVDDFGIAGKTKEEIDGFIAKLREEGLVLTEEDEFSEFLGIRFEHMEDGRIHMTQCGLIQKILTTAGMQECNPKKTPATTTPLGKDKEGAAMNESWMSRIK